MNFIRNFSYYAAVLFNTMFAILASVTLIGIVFITKPQQVMHNVPPDWWLPIMLIMVPSQLVSQYFTWKTVFRRDVPTPLAISKHQPKIPTILRPTVAFVWVANFLIGFIIVVSLFEPAPGRNPRFTFYLLLAFFTFALTTFANVFLMLLARTLTTNENWIELLWKYRIAIDVAIAVVAIIYYRLAV